VSLIVEYLKKRLIQAIFLTGNKLVENIQHNILYIYLTYNFVL